MTILGEDRRRAEQHEPHDGGEQVGGGRARRVRQPVPTVLGSRACSWRLVMSQADAEHQHSPWPDAGSSRHAGDAEREAAVDRGVARAAVTSSAATLAPTGPNRCAARRYSRAYRRRASDPTTAIEPQHLPRDARGPPAASAIRMRPPAISRPDPGDPFQVRDRGRQRCPRASPGRRPSRPAPRGCAGRCVRPATSSSVSKNHAWSCDLRQQRRAAGRRASALNPHCASEKRGAQRQAQQQVVAARDELALRPPGHP